METTNLNQAIRPTFNLLKFMVNGKIVNGESISLMGVYAG
jgi:hypothetical protein